MSKPSPHSIARRNLAWRIEQFLREQEVIPRPTLTGWQADQVLEAIELLDAGQFADGERVIMKVVNARVFEPAVNVPNDWKNVRQLLERLKQVLAG